VIIHYHNNVDLIRIWGLWLRTRKVGVMD
jgi:hypothetical protein